MKTTSPPLHHVGIVQPSVDLAMEMMQVMGLEEDYRGYVDQWSALCIFTLAKSGSPVEFVIPDAGPLLRFNKGFGGLHHLAFVTEDLDALGLELAKEDIRFLEPEHVKGAGPFLCNFVSPVYTRGVTVEYVQLLDT